jgi:hypothetical protein
MSVEAGRPPLSVERGVEVVQSPEEQFNDLMDAVRPRLADLDDNPELEPAVRSAYAALQPIRVTTYLPILVERAVRARLHSSRTHGEIHVSG